MTVTENQKKSLAITTAVFGLFLLVLFVLKFNDTITEMVELGGGGGGGGEVAVNFGDSDFGSGNNFESMEPVAAKSKSTAPKTTAADEVVVSDNSDAPAVADIKKSDKPKKDEPKKEPVQPERRPDKSTSTAISDLLNGSNTGGDGNDSRAGNKGKSSGDPNARGYDGGGGEGDGEGGGKGGGKGKGTGLGEGDGYGPGKGTGSGGSWNLDGRKLSGSSLVVQKCNEYGKVVVEVKVNRQGNVVGTKFTKGTQNTTQCLLDAAYATARTFKWAAKPDAPEVQTGTITINFRLGE